MDYIDIEANFTTDEWNSYKSLIKECPNLTQIAY